MATLVPSVVIQTSLSITRFVFQSCHVLFHVDHVNITLCFNIHTFSLQNVNLLQQFISPQTGIVYDPTRTGNEFLSTLKCRISDMLTI